MFHRKIIDDLQKWSQKENRKPLILRGARQVGKTTAVNMFGKDFSNYIYLNLEIKKESDLFDHNLDVEQLIQLILLNKKISLKKGKTLLFVDEIQNNANAVAIMRYFYEKLPDIFVIGAGSMLEIMLSSKQISFPVGRVEYLFMYPLTFEEYLIASDNEQALNLYHQVPVPQFAIETLLNLFHHYTMIGGMPEIIQTYTINNDISRLRSSYESLLSSYRDDVSKYTTSTTMKQVIRHVIETSNTEAGKRITFQGFGHSNYKSREVGEALKILQRAMILRLIYPTTNLTLPAIVNHKKKPKLQYLDTGLLNYSLGLQTHFLTHQDLHSFYQGLLAEHIITQELLARDSGSNHSIQFWVREQKASNAEVDFVIQHKDLLIPVEVKSGKSGTLRSLHQFIDASEHNYAVRLYSGNLEIQENTTPKGKPYKLLNLPYCFSGKIVDYIQYLIDS